MRLECRISGLGQVPVLHELRVDAELFLFLLLHVYKIFQANISGCG